MFDITDENAAIQAQFNAAAKARLDDPMITDEPRETSTLDPGFTFLGDDGPTGEFDEAPGDFENDVLARLENIENGIDEIKSTMTKISDALAVVVDQVEPTIEMVTNSKLFKMLTGPAKPAPKPKGIGK